MSLVRNVRWSKHKNTLFLKGAFPSLVLDHACSTGNKLLPSWNKQKKVLFLMGRKKFKHKPPIIFNLLHPTAYTTTEHHRPMARCLVLSDVTWRGITANCRTVPELWTDFDPQNRLTLIKHTLLPENTGHVGNKPLSLCPSTTPMCRIQTHKAREQLGISWDAQTATILQTVPVIRPIKEATKAAASWLNTLQVQEPTLLLGNRGKSLGRSRAGSGRGSLRKLLS